MTIEIKSSEFFLITASILSRISHLENLITINEKLHDMYYPEIEELKQLRLKLYNDLNVE